MCKYVNRLFQKSNDVSALFFEDDSYCGMGESLCIKQVGAHKMEIHLNPPPKMWDLWIRRHHRGQYWRIRKSDIFWVFPFSSDHFVRGWSAIRYWDSVQSGIVDPLQMHFHCTESNFVWSDINCLRSSQWSEHTFTEKVCSEDLKYMTFLGYFCSLWPFWTTLNHTLQCESPPKGHDS